MGGMNASRARNSVGGRPPNCCADDGSCRHSTGDGSVNYAPQQRINGIPYFAEVALGYQGLPPGRDSDVAAIALYYGGFSRYLPGQTYELTLEWTYALVVTPWLTIQPDIQYIIHPSGKSSVSNALVVGVQLSLQF